MRLPDEARRNHRDLVLGVLASNRRALAWYRRLGMAEVARRGDDNIKITMRLSMPAGRAPKGST